MAKQRITQILERVRIPTKFPKRDIEPIGVTYIGEISGHGSGLYIRIPGDICEFYGLTAGEKIRLSLLHRKRWTEIEEAD